MHKRPLEEPMIHEKQFNHPSIAPEARNLFLELYKKEKDFDKAADSASGRTENGCFWFEE